MHSASAKSALMMRERGSPQGFRAACQRLSHSPKRRCGCRTSARSSSRRVPRVRDVDPSRLDLPQRSDAGDRSVARRICHFRHKRNPSTHAQRQGSRYRPELLERRYSQSDAIPVKIKGRHYLITSEEGGSGQFNAKGDRSACAAGRTPWHGENSRHRK